MKPARIAAWASGIFAAVSLGLAVFGFGETFSRSNPIKVVQAIVLCAWIVLPPVWFWYEYFFVPRDSKQSFEEFKYGQDVAAKIWLGLVTALLGLYFGTNIFK